MRITPENCITIAVDYQTRLVPAMAHERELIHNSRILLQGLRVLDVPVLVSQQYTKGLGETVPEIRELVADCPVFDKITFSCWQNDAIREAVIASGRKTVIICGIESHVCALQTVIDLCADGYRVRLRGGLRGFPQGFRQGHRSQAGREGRCHPHLLRGAAV